MSDPERPNLTEGWPGEPDADLAGFAEDFHAALPSLPPEALARVERKLQAELAQSPPRRRWRYLAAAAAVLLALGAGGYLGLRPGPDERDGAPVEDHYRVEFAPPRAPVPPQPPPVRLEEHQSLYAD